MKRTPFVIFFQGRSGSTMLASLLISHRDVLCRNEEFSLDNAPGFDARGERKRMLVPFFGEPELIQPTAAECQLRLEKIFTRPFGAVGFKFKFPGQTDMFPEVLDGLYRRSASLRVIHLVRINQMKRGVSRQHLVRLMQSPSMRELRGGNMQTENRSRKFVVDIDLLKSFFERAERHQERLNQILSRFPHRHQVTYEELAADPQHSMFELLSFLGVDPNEPLTTKYRKLTPDSLRDIVENYDQLRRVFKGTEYESFLDREG